MYSFILIFYITKHQDLTRKNLEKPLVHEVELSLCSLHWENYFILLLIFRI